ncbi:hypothetical protein HMPREF0297_1243 [Corynebacterium jeikeium ATCC 43734]|nr:hypothetical protein HMPREF0297_1243 [Corynebacterium jeikeium ATCC 43734]
MSHWIFFSHGRDQRHKEDSKIYDELGRVTLVDKREYLRHTFVV